jgi:formate--tetrahydrofolate ligase
MVVTEAGFAFELGAEKFFDINCGYGGFAPSCTVLVATLRALKMHGGAPLDTVGAPNMVALIAGLPNLEKHLENIRRFEQPCVVAINRFPTDPPDELAAVVAHCASLGIDAVVADPFGTGGPGCTALAERVHAVATASPPHFRPLYDWSASIEEKIMTIAHAMYGAEAVDYTPRAKRDRAHLEKLGHGGLPVCIAKTQQSLSDNPKLLGRPKDFLVTVREIQLAAGAGFVIPITGEILRMPGLPKRPLAERFDLDAHGDIVLREDA